MSRIIYAGNFQIPVQTSCAAALARRNIQINFFPRQACRLVRKYDNFTENRLLPYRAQDRVIHQRNVGPHFYLPIVGLANE